MEIILNVLSLNIWGIPLISRNRLTRIKAISKQLSLGEYDIVSLQEVWSKQDSQFLQQATKDVLPYSHHFYSGVTGAGLLVLSRFPIESSLFHAWSVNGYFHCFHHADWFGGKGVGLCRIRIGTNQHVHIYNAHLHAEYDINKSNYKVHRIIQAFDTAQFIAATRGDSIIQILAGDLNTNPHDLVFKLLSHIGELTDACHLDSIGTYACPTNTYTSKKALMFHSTGERIDHILYRTCNKIKAKVLDYQLPWSNTVPDTLYSYSDHEAIQATFNMRKKDIEPTASSKLDFTVLSDVLNDEYHIKKFTRDLEQKKNTVYIKDAIILCDNHLIQLDSDRLFYFIVSIFLLSIIILVYKFPILYINMAINLIIKLLLFTIFIYSIFMASIWNLMERNGIISGRNAMKLKLYNTCCSNSEL